MSAQHTLGRLKLTLGKKMEWDYMLNTHDGKPIAYFGHYKPMSLKEGKANARRLVACWNACEGLTTESLEAAGNACNGWKLASYAMNDAKAHRDELLAALKEVLAAVRHSNRLPETVMQFEEKVERVKKAAAQAESAIAKAEGGAA